MWATICPDGVDRLQAHFDDEQSAITDASYFSGRTYCGDWCGRDGDKTCPGGKHAAERIDWDGFSGGD